MPITADILRRLAALQLPGPSLREVMGIIGALEADNELKVQALQLVIDEHRSAEAARTRLYRQRGGGAIPDELRAAVYARDGYRCVYCGSEQNLQCDHVIPVSKQGPTTFENLATACQPCNARKRDRDRKYLERSKDVHPNSPDIGRTQTGPSSEKARTLAAISTENAIDLASLSTLPSADSSKESKSLVVTPARSTDRARAGKGTAIDPTAPLTNKNLDYALEHGFLRQRAFDEWLRFKDHSLKKGVTYRNWDAAWRNWVTSPFQANGHSNGAANGIVAAADNLIEHLGGRDAVAGYTPGSAGPDAKTKADGVDREPRTADLFGLPKG